MQSVAKAQALVRDLSDKISKRYAGSSTINTVRIAADANGWPMIFLSIGGSEVEGASVIVIRISNPNAVTKDILGLSTFAYAPHLLEFAYELTSGGFPIPSAKDLIIAEFEAIKTGVKFELKAIANGTAVTETSLNAATPVIDLDELYWPTKSV